jgi:hypothetical protein
VLFDILRARLVVGNQAEGRGLANTAVLFRKIMLNRGCDSRLFTCIHGRTICAGFVLMPDEGILFASALCANISSLLTSKAREKYSLFSPVNVGNSAFEN